MCQRLTGHASPLLVLICCQRERVGPGARRPAAPDHLGHKPRRRVRPPSKPVVSHRPIDSGAPCWGRSKWTPTSEVAHGAAGNLTVIVFLSLSGCFPEYSPLAG